MQWIKSIINKGFNLSYNIYNYLVFKINKVTVALSVIKGINGYLYLKNYGQIIIGNNVKITSAYRYNAIGGQTFTSIVVSRDAKLIIGDNVGISNSAIFCKKQIEIKEDTLIGGDCKIYDTDFHSLEYKDRVINGDSNVKSDAVTIGKGCFIGTGCIILKGASIGDYSVIAAGSIVSKQIPSNQIWGGNPIKFIKEINVN